MIAIDDIRFFQILVGTGSMAAAARELNVSPSAITQRLQQMEKRYEVLLIDRSTRHLRLTSEGELLFERGIAICQETDALFDLLKARSGLVAGHLRVSAPLGFGRRHIAPLIAQFHKLHRELKVSLTLYDKLQVRDSNASDIIFNIGQLRDSTMVGHTIAPNERLLCAAPKYLKAHGLPRVPEDLLQHACLMLSENNEDVSLWKFSQAEEERHIRIDPALISNDGEVIRQWAMQGMGIALRSEWDVAEHIRAGKLVRLLPDWSLPTADIVALLPQRKGISARSRTFLEYVRSHLSPLPPWRQEKRD